MAARSSSKHPNPLVLGSLSFSALVVVGALLLVVADCARPSTTTTTTTTPSSSSSSSLPLAASAVDEHVEKKPASTAADNEVESFSQHRAGGHGSHHGQAGSHQLDQSSAQYYYGGGYGGGYGGYGGGRGYGSYGGGRGYGYGGGGHGWVPADQTEQFGDGYNPYYSNGYNRNNNKPGRRSHGGWGGYTSSNMMQQDQAAAESRQSEQVEDVEEEAYGESYNGPDRGRWFRPGPVHGSGYGGEWSQTKRAAASHGAAHTAPHRP